MVAFASANCAFNSSTDCGTAAATAEVTDPDVAGLLAEDLASPRDRALLGSSSMRETGPWGATDRREALSGVKVSSGEGERALLLYAGGPLCGVSNCTGLCSANYTTQGLEYSALVLTLPCDAPLSPFFNGVAAAPEPSAAR
jgi:hypothetical protein